MLIQLQRFFKLPWFIFTLLLSLSSSIQANSKNLTPVKLQLKWTHQFQFAGFYMAKAQGYYQKAGLDVSFIEVNPAMDPVQAVLEGQAQFGVGTTDLLQNVSKGDPVVVLGVTFQHSPLALATTSPEIKSPIDLIGRKVMIEDNSAELFAYLKKFGITKKDIILHRHRLTPADLIAGKVDALSIYTTTELSDLKTANIPHKVFYPIETGIDFYGDNLFTTQDMINTHPDVVAAFRDASFKGWQYALTHKEETIRHILSDYLTTRSYEDLQFEANVTTELMQNNRIYPGNMTLQHWQEIAEVYHQMGFLVSPPELTNFLYDPNQRRADIESQLTLFTTLSIIFALLAIFAFVLARRLKLLNTKYSTLVAQSPVAFMVLNRRFHVMEWNEQATQTFGWHENEVMGKNIFKFLVANEDQDKVNQTLSKVLESNSNIHLTNKNNTKSGQEVICSWTNSGFQHNGEHYIICMALNITDEYEIENTAKKLDVNTNLDNDNEFKADLCELMNLSLTLWEDSTGESKVELAQQSRLWRVTLDGGSCKTRTLDKYLSVTHIPANPRWRIVIKTVNFVLEAVKNHPKREQLIALKETFMLKDSRSKRIKESNKT